MNPYAFDAVFWVAVVCCAVAQLFILRAALATRSATAAAASLPPIRRAVEVVWVLVPAVALALVFAATWRAMHPAHLVPTAADAPVGGGGPR